MYFLYHLQTLEPHVSYTYFLFLFLFLIMKIKRFKSDINFSFEKLKIANL